MKKIHHFLETHKMSLIFIGLMLLSSKSVFALSDPFKEAGDTIKTFFGYALTFIQLVAGVVGILGGFKVYSKMNAGEPDVVKVASQWIGSCIFIILLGGILKGFFGMG
jgi:hypothetical protein